jgi:hypothetical protein
MRFVKAKGHLSSGSIGGEPREWAGGRGERSMESLGGYASQERMEGKCLGEKALD